MSTCIRKILVNRLVRSLGNDKELEKRIYNKCKPNSRYNVDEPKFILFPSSDISEKQIMEIRKDDVIKMVKKDKYSNYLITVDKDQFNKSILDSVVKNGPFYNKNDLDIKKEKVVVEFSSPNIAKPFHIGHLHSTVLGNCLSNLLKAFDHDVVRLNYLGDYGIQNVMLSMGFMRYGDEEKLKADPLKHLYEVYVKINNKIQEEKVDNDVRSTPIYKEIKNIFLKIDSGEPPEEYDSIRKKLIDISESEYDKMYKRMGIEFDEIHSESMYREKSQQLVKSLNEQGMLEDRDGMGVLRCEDDGKEFEVPIQKSDKSALYLTRDIVAALDRYEKFKFDQIHYVVASDQRKHFQNLLNSLKKLHPEIWQNVNLTKFHIQFARVHGVSTRLGKSIFLDELLDKAKAEIQKIIKASPNTRISMDEFDKVADHLAISSIFIQYMSKSRSQSYAYDWERVVNLKADSGLFLQYCHARLCSLREGVNIDTIGTIDHTLLTEKEAAILIQQLARYPDVLEMALITFQPCKVVQYLFELGHSVNTAYSALKVIDQSDNIAEARLGLFDCARQTLAHGLKILGLEPLNKM